MFGKLSLDAIPFHEPIVMITVAMIAIGVMAAAVPEALGDRAAAFAVGNAVIRLVWALPWFTKRRLVGVPWWRPVLYSVVPAVLWLASIWIALRVRAAKPWPLRTRSRMVGTLDTS